MVRGLEYLMKEKKLQELDLFVLEKRRQRSVLDTVFFSIPKVMEKPNPNSTQ